MFASIGELFLVAAHVEDTIRFNLTCEAGDLSDREWERFGLLGFATLAKAFEKNFAPRSSDYVTFCSLMAEIRERMEMRHAIAHGFPIIKGDGITMLRPRLLADGTQFTPLTSDAISTNARELHRALGEAMELVGAWPG
jgi:hypothetical protein